jgi:hypothetical protein
MKIIKITLSFLILFSLGAFISENLKVLDEGGGYIFLLFAILSFSMLALINFSCFLKIRMSLILLFIFVLYLTFNYAFDTLDMAKIKAVTLGTTGGVVFAILLGVMSTFSIVNIFDADNSRSTHKLVIIPLVFIYSLVILFFSIEAFQFYLSTIRSDLFLIDGGDGLYQRPAALMLIQFMISTSLITAVLIKGYKATLLHTIIVLLLCVNAIVYMVLSQLLGSNSGLASIAGFLVMFLSFIFIVSSKESKKFILKVNLKSIVLGWIGKKVIFGITLALFTMVSFFTYLLFLLDMKMTDLRIFGFSSGTSSSVDSRLAILQKNYVEQLSYNPIFGHTQADALTTGEGSYAHSLISIFSHLGLIGGILFSFLLLFMYREIARSYMNYSLYDSPKFRLFRLFSLGLVLLYALLTAFITWMPLWFAIGAFGISFYFKRDREIICFSEIK